MSVIDLTLKGLKVLSPAVFEDERGFFLELYRKSSYEKEGISCSFVQDNHSFSQHHTLRGLHFQQGIGQDKLVSVVEGEIYDVAVDLRRSSPTFGQWEGVILDGISHKQFFIPAGFAHGFYVMSASAHVLYKVSREYDPALELGFLWNDLPIPWPLQGEPILSKKDRNLRSFEAMNPWFPL